MTVYTESALVTREVAVPEGKGLIELVVTPLPTETIRGSLYTEGSDGLRVLSTRFRTRAVKEDTRQSVRAKEESVRSLELDAQRVKKEMQVSQQDLDFLQKLENFTSATMQGLADKGKLDVEATIKLSTYVMESRARHATAMVDQEQKLQANAGSTRFAQRQLQELSAGSRRTEIDAVIVVDKADAPAASVRLNYLVGAATWRPQYRFRSGGDKDPVQLEYLAAIEQRSGEEWPDARVTLSTAQPALNATIPDLLPLETTVLEVAEGEGGKAGERDPNSLSIDATRAQARAFRGQAQQAMVGNDAKAGGAFLNEAAALDQAEELLAADEDREERKGPAAGPPAVGGGPSVTYRLRSRLTIPSRKDQQLVEVSRAAMTPEYFAKAVPVLSPRVYRLAKLTNTGDSVLLPGEATMYVGSDFVGRMSLPQVAVGEPFTVGFGVDPQLQIGRRLVEKSRAIQGGNQVYSYRFRIVVRNFKSTPVNLQLWDRMPWTESSAVAVNLIDVRPDLSADAPYVRLMRPDNLLRWDLTVPPGTIGDKALVVAYQFKLEYARNMAIEYFRSGGLVESPIGGMGGMGGGMR